MVRIVAFVIVAVMLLGGCTEVRVDVKDSVVFTSVYCKVEK